MTAVDTPRLTRPTRHERAVALTGIGIVLVLVAAAVTAHWPLIAAAVPVLFGVTLAKNHYRKERREPRAPTSNRRL